MCLFYSQKLPLLLSKVVTRTSVIASCSSFKLLFELLTVQFPCVSLELGNESRLLGATEQQSARVKTDDDVKNCCS